VPTQKPVELSRAMRALWGTAESGRRGPKPAMSVRSIAAEAVALADAEGLDAVTMAALAKRLGFTTMSLYRYVDSRLDLLAVMVDEALGPAPELNRRRGWRGQVEEWARAEAAQLYAHPWALDVRTGTPPLGPHVLAWTDLGFQALGKADLAPQQTASSLLIIDGYVRSSVQLALQYADAEATDTWAAQLRLVVDPDEMPAMSEVLASGAFEDGTEMGFPGEEFEFGLGLLLDGIEKLARARH
jgi:AcrR family transcriptional regulator